MLCYKIWNMNFPLWDCIHSDKQMIEHHIIHIAGGRNEYTQIT